jgi:hypothetical protein
MRTPSPPSDEGEEEDTKVLLEKMKETVEGMKKRQSEVGVASHGRKLSLAMRLSLSPSKREAEFERAWNRASEEREKEEDEIKTPLLDVDAHIEGKVFEPRRVKIFGATDVTEGSALEGVGELVKTPAERKREVDVKEKNSDGAGRDLSILSEVPAAMTTRRRTTRRAAAGASADDAVLDSDAKKGSKKSSESDVKAEVEVLGVVPPTRKARFIRSKKAQHVEDIPEVN